MTLEEKWNELSGLKKSFGEAQDLYSQYVGGEYTVPNMVKSKLTEAYGANKDLITEENKAQEELNVTPYNYAADLQKGRFAGNPVLAGQAAAQREAAIERKLQDIRGVRQTREGTIADIINSVAGGFKAATDKVGAKAEAAKSMYDTSFGEYQVMSAEEEKRKELELAAEAEKNRREEWERDFAEQQRQFDAQLRKGSGGGGGGGGGGRSLTPEQTQNNVNEAINKALDVLAQEDVAGGGDPDRQLSPEERTRAKNRIAAIAQQHGVDTNELYNLAWGQGGFGEWNPPVQAPAPAQKSSSSGSRSNTISGLPNINLSVNPIKKLFGIK